MCATDLPHAALVEGFAVIATLLGGLNCSDQPLRVIWVPGCKPSWELARHSAPGGAADDSRRNQRDGAGQQPAAADDPVGILFPAKCGDDERAAERGPGAAAAHVDSGVLRPALRTRARVARAHPRQGNRIKREMAERELPRPRSGSGSAGFATFWKERSWLPSSST